MFHHILAAVAVILSCHVTGCLHQIQTHSSVLLAHPLWCLEWQWFQGVLDSKMEQSKTFIQGYKTAGDRSHSGLIVSMLIPGASGSGFDQALAGDTALCSWARDLTLPVPLSTQGYKWVLANCWGNLTNCRGSDLTCDGLASHPGGSRSTPSCFMLQKLGKALAAMSQSAPSLHSWRDAWAGERRWSHQFLECEAREEFPPATFCMVFACRPLLSLLMN